MASYRRRLPAGAAAVRSSYGTAPGPPWCYDRDTDRVRKVKAGTPVSASSRSRLIVAVALAAAAAAAASARPVRAAVARPVHPTAAGPSAPPSPPTAPTAADLNLVHLDAIVLDRAGRPVRHLRARDFDLRVDGTRLPVDGVEFLPRSRGGDAGTAGGRTFGLLLDDYHVPAGPDTARVRQALAQFVGTTLAPDDRVLVMKPLDRLHAVEPAADRAGIASAVQAFDGRAGDFTPRTAFERAFVPRAPAAAEAVRAQLVLSALEALTTQLGRTGPGRKALLFVTEGFADTRTRRNIPLPDLQGVLRAANQFDVAVYPVDPAETAPAGAARTLLETLAARTGGAIIGGGTGLAAGLTRAAADLNGYYLLTFRSPRADGRFHTITLRVDRPGVRVEARPEYWLPSAADVRLAERLRRARLEPLPRLPPFVPTRISGLIRPWFGIARGQNGKTEVTMTWEPDHPGLEGRLPVDAGEIVLNAATAGGTALFHGTVGPVSSGRAAPGLARRAVFDAPPGILRLDIQIRTANGRPLDTDVRTLDVPSMETKRTELSTPEVFRSSTARGFAALGRDPDAAPVVSRDFLRTERLLVRVRAYGPGATPATVTARLLNLTGAPMRALARVPGSLSNGAVQFDLPLAAFPPGEYTIELTATSPGGRARSLVAFRIVG